MSESNKIIERLDTISRAVTSLSDRVNNIEIQRSSHDDNVTQSPAQPPVDVDVQGQDGGAIGEDVPVSPYYNAVGASADIQREFDSLKDSLNRVQIPKRYKVNDSTRGIGKDGKPTLTVLSFKFIDFIGHAATSIYNMII